MKLMNTKTNQIIDIDDKNKDFFLKNENWKALKVEETDKATEKDKKEIKKNDKSE